VAVAVLAAGASLMIAAPAVASASSSSHKAPSLAVDQVNLVSDLPGWAALTDPDLKNPWGLALSSTSPLWVANTGTSTSTLYSSAPESTTATKVAAVRVTFPQFPALPTGQVFNGGPGFVLSNGATSGPAAFIFSTITGHIEAWSPTVDPHLGDAEVKATEPGAVYTGLAIATTSTGAQQLYAANFGQGRIDVFDSSFAMVDTPSWLFHDSELPKGYSPFNAQTLDGNIYVTYAKIDPKTGLQVTGDGLGFVDEYSPDGVLISRVDERHSLNAPWGLAIAPSTWGNLAGDLLIGNFGSGQITVVEPGSNGLFHDHIEGQLTDSSGAVVSIPDLWALLPGTASTGGTDAIWFSAGIDNQQDGLLGVLRRP